MIDKSTFVANYLPREQQAMARYLLPDEEHSLEEWRSLWQKQLNQPVK